MFQAFQAGPFILWTRLAFVLVGIWLSLEFFLRLATSANLSLQHFRERGVLYIAAFFLGARGFAMLADYRSFLREPLKIFYLSDGDFSFLGGAVGIAIVLFFVTRGHRTTFLQWLDALLPAASLGLFFEWLGAFLSGHAYGRPTDVFWAYTYDAESVRYSVPIHPVQLYYAFFFLFLTFLLLVVRKKSKRVGAETLLGILCAAIATFVFESFRGDFSIPVFATQIDFVLIIALFLSLGVFAAFEQRISRRVSLTYETILLALAGGYMVARPFLDLETYELRFSQLLAVLALMATIVYIVDHRRRYPYL